MSPTRLAWNPLRAKTRTAAHSSCCRLSSTADDFSATAAKSLLLLLPVCQRRRLRGAQILDRPRDPPHHLLQLARDDPDLVRLALSDQRERLEVLVREQLGVRLALVDGREDGLDRLRLAFGAKHGGLLLALGLENRRLLLALGLEDLRLPRAFCLQDRGPLFTVGAHLLLHRVLNGRGRVGRLQLDAVDADPPLAGRFVEHAAQPAVDLVARRERLL